MVCLFETRCSGIKAETTIKKLGFNYYALNEARGYVGGIWALWNKEIKATCIHNHEQFLQFEIQDQEKGKWNLFVIYANPHAQIRDSVWPLIESKCSNNIPLLLAGDFNEIASISEQKGGSPPNIQRCNKFQSWINKCSLIDLIPAGPFFTWEGPKRHGQRKLFKRLDRALCNQNWRTSFSDASSKCLARIHSDHHHFLITTEDQNQSFKDRLEQLQTSLKTWNKEVFGDITKRKRRLLNRLEGIQISLDRKYNPFLDNLGRRLAKELESVLDQEEALWFQKARCQWIRDGDRNTRYYHTKTISHRRRNKILMLKNNSGDWIEDLEEIKRTIVSFYKELFKEDLEQRSISFPVFGWPSIETHEWESINSPFCPEEIKNVVFNIGGSKALESDGFPASFYHQNWDTVGVRFKRSQEVGKYLGVEIIHGRKTKCKFSHIMDKVQNRLAGWKANCLSMAERATLIQSVCSSMPLYHMQHNMLPKSVINQVEKLERAFLWGSSPEKKHCHHIGWNKICTPKALGGLGILSLREMNMAFFYKLAWQLLTKEDNL
ncbi:ribonuclease H [Senna tora]|uniref:Ribonuclease H n=1 Tax=Senna tora TaxID=362788 RepID=A0A834X5V5_9FABA|nr:ribonuclease H [Senna tora]